ncbi:MAG: family 16 glycosylhydrolase [Bacteroidales bacterium]|nr:family 16 glycosylhydrolase [Bacteroidales bacterium]
MNSKMLLSTLLACGALFIAPSCDKDDNNVEPTVTALSVSASELNFDGLAGEKEITVTSEREWSVIIDKDWVTVTPDNSTEKSTVVTVNVLKSDEYEPREATITFMSGLARQAVTVKQAGGDGVPDPNAIVCPIEGYKLVWNDEFDQTSTSLNANDWRHEVQNSGWVNNELQNYVNEKSPEGKRVTEVKDGILKIKCLKENDKIYSGRVYAHDKQGWQYGYIEARIKLPKGKGTWPAFWMMPVNVDWANEGWPKCGEIDIMEEVGANPNYVSSSLHAEGHVHTLGNQVTHEMLCEGAEDDFHTYAMEWTKEGITTYVDGKVQLSYKSDGTVKNYPYDKPYYIILNLAWGGSWGGYKGIDESALPTTMQVDYVRVFQKK